MTANHTSSRGEARKQFILDTLQRLQRPICLADLAPRASQHGAYEKAFRELKAEGRIVLARTGPYGRKYYALAPSAGRRHHGADDRREAP